MNMCELVVCECKRNVVFMWLPRLTSLTHTHTRTHSHTHTHAHTHTLAFTLTPQETLKAAAPDNDVIDLVCCHRRFSSALSKTEVLHAEVETLASKRHDFDAPRVRVSTVANRSTCFLLIWGVSFATYPDSTILRTDRTVVAIDIKVLNSHGSVAIDIKVLNSHGY